MKKILPFRKNNLIDPFTSFLNDRFKQRLENKYNQKPYFKKYGKIKTLAFLSSYFFNVFSTITASTLIYFFVYQMTQYWFPSLIVTIVFLGLLEVSKRVITTTLFQNIFQHNQIPILLVLATLTLTLMSIAFSFYGSKKIVLELSSKPSVINETDLVKPIEDKIKKIDFEIEKSRSTKWKGVTTNTAQQTIATLSKQKSILENEIIRLRKRTNTSNDAIITNHNFATQLKSQHFAIVSFLLELFFLITISYCEFYDFRSYVEITSTSSSNKNTAYTRDRTSYDITEKSEQRPITRTIAKHIAKPIASPITKKITKYEEKDMTITDDKNRNDKNDSDIKIIETAIKQVKTRISSADYRIRHNIGKRATSLKNKQQFNEELGVLEEKLKLASKEKPLELQ